MEGNIVEDDDVAWVKFGGKLGARSVRLVSRVLVEVASMKTSRVKAWSKKGLPARSNSRVPFGCRDACPERLFCD